MHRYTGPLEWIRTLIEWLFSAIERFFVAIVNFILDILGGILDLIPKPAWLSNAITELQSLLNQFGLYADVLALDVAFSIFLSAYAIRFTIRRIPFIG